MRLSISFQLRTDHTDHAWQESSLCAHRGRAYSGAKPRRRVPNPTLETRSETELRNPLIGANTSWIGLYGNVRLN